MIAKPRAVAADQRLKGVVFGKVESVRDPKKLNRVLVSLPWYAKGYRVWARVCHFYAAKDKGSTWIPDEGCEVLVAFAHGDMRWPFVLGCLHGPVDKPPVARTASSDIRTVRTPRGSELTFDETNGTIQLKTAKGSASILLDEQKGTLTIEAKQKLELKAQKIELKGTSIAIDGSADVTVTGKPINLN